MMTLFLLFFPLVASGLVFLSGHRMSPKLALGLASVQLGMTVAALFSFLRDGSDQFYIFYDWISAPKISFHLGLDGLSLVLVLLTNLLIPLIILSGFNRIIRKKLAELTIQLGNKCFIMGQYQGWPLHIPDHVGNCKSFTRPGYT